ncbi:hypothetical protein [Vibrio phage PhiImVa-1]|nr:hypothetical protein [Vibrio phage PhiImVa-1]
MKITLTLEEAINYIKQHTDMGDFADAEIVIEGFDKPAEPKQEQEPEAVEEKPAPKKRRRRKAKEEENVTQEQLDAIASEVDKELKEEFKEELNATIPEPTTGSADESATDSETTRTEVQPDLFEGVNEEVIKDEIVSTESAEESGAQQLASEPEVAQSILDEGINVPVSEEPSLFDTPVSTPSLFPEDEATESFEDTEMSLIDEVLAETGDDEAFNPEPTMDIFDQSIPYEEREAFAKANGLVPPLF